MKQKIHLHKDSAVTEILGTMLLLVISLIIFSTVYFSVLSIPQKETAPNANVAFSFDTTNITLSHLSGAPVGPETIISIQIDDTIISKPINEFGSWDTIDDDNVWGFGEKITYEHGESMLSSKNITVSILDENSNSLVLHGNYYQPPTYTPSVSTELNNISFLQAGPTVEITAAADFLLDDVALYYRYSADGSFSAGSVYTLFNNDSSHPWEWTFDFPHGTGWYEFYSIGYVNSQSENAPSSPDTSCHYTLAPMISNPDPSQGNTGVELNPTLEITVTDGDNGDENVMDLTWFSNATGSWQQIHSDNNIGNGTYSFDTTGLMTEYETTYYWKVSVTDGTNTVDSPEYHFTTRGENNPPNNPTNPSPSHKSTDISTNTVLSWTGGDSDGDSVTYDVYFGPSSSPSKVISNQTANTYNPGSLNYDETYYWKIITWDEHGASSVGPVWEFVTEEQQILTAVFSPSRDSYILESHPNDNYGNRDYLNVGSLFYNNAVRSLISFDLNSISGKSIVSAELKMYKFDYYYYSPNGRSYDIHRITQNWNENSVKWNNRPNYRSSITDSDIVPNNYNWIIWDVTEDVQNFVNGDINHGWLIKDNDEEYYTMYSRFSSKEYSNSNYRPVLEVTYLD